MGLIRLVADHTTPSEGVRYAFPELAILENALIRATDDQRAKLLGLVSGIASLVEGKE